MRRFLFMAAVLSATLLFFLPVLGNVNSTIFLPILRHEPPAPTDLVVNEVLALNGTVNADPQTTLYYDWIELYNPTNATIDASGYMLSDDPDDPAQWQIPDGTIIAAYDHLLIYANGENWESLYANFKLSDNGETLVLSRPDGAIVDQFEFGEQVADVSFGRLTDGGWQTGYFGRPSPNAANVNSLTHQAKNPSPTFSQPSGFYQTTQAIMLTTSLSSETYYTIDGSTPTEQSTRYTGNPIVLTETTVIKARTFSSSAHPSPAVAHTYLIAEPSQLPVISLGINPDYLWDDQTGIYVQGTNGINWELCDNEPGNYYQDWERPLTIELLYPNGEQGFMESAGVKIFGGCTRHTQYPQKSLAIHFRDRYGNDTLKHSLFPSSSVAQFSSLVLRNGGQDGTVTMMRESLIQEMLHETLDVDGRLGQPAVVYINGAYWGIHTIHEKLNEDYLEEKHGVDSKEFDILELDSDVSEGSADHYTQLLAYIEQHDLANPTHYAYVQTQIDTDQYIDYLVAQIYFANADWRRRNIKYWRPQTEDGRWRWFIFDLDYAMTLEHYASGVGYPALDLALSEGIYPDWSTYLLRQLVRNDSFKHDLVQRLAIHTDITFTPAYVTAAIDTYKATLEPEIPRHIARWNAPSTIEMWYDNIDILYTFAEDRPPFIYREIERNFGIPNERIALEIAAVGGHIAANSIDLGTAQTVAIYPDLPLKLEAIPDENHSFVRWQGASTSTDSTVELAFTSSQTITAIFEPSPQPVINEIHYNPSGDLQGDDALYEFIELYNPHDVALDLTGYAMTEGIVYTFTAGTIMPPDSYLVLAQTAATYLDLNAPVYQWTDGGLKNSGERLALSTPTGTIADEVTYDDGGLWAAAPDGDGASLMLLAADLDNSLPASWVASLTIGGSPGGLNE